VNNNSILPVLSAITTCIIFGLSFLFSKQAIDAANPLSLLAFRFLTAFTVMSVLVLIKVIKINYKNKNLKGLLAVSIMQPVFYFICESYGIKYSSSSEAGMMIALIPIVVSIMSVYFLKEKPSLLQWIFIVLSVSGVIFIVLMDSSNSSSGNFTGILFLFGAVISGSAFNILSRRYSTTFSPMELTYFMMGTGAVFFNAASIIQHIINGSLGSYFAPLTKANFDISIFYLGILSSIIAFFLLNFALSKIEASKTTVFTNLTTIVSILAGVIFLHERFHYYHLIGSMLILVGVWGTNYYGAKNTIESELELKG
jgi:drug/metabolite transporter (DMT)-like permease